MRRTWVKALAGIAMTAALAACGTSSSDNSNTPGCTVNCGGGGPAAPAGISASPAAVSGGNSATVTWTAVTGAASYNIYTSSTPSISITSSTPKVNVVSAAIPPAQVSGTVSGLANNAAQYFFVSSLDSTGTEGSASSAVCAVPSSGAARALQNTFTLWDGLCSSTFNASKWTASPFARSVQNRAALLKAGGTNLESLTTRGLTYQSALKMAGISAAKRATNLLVDVTVPSALVTRTGTAVVRAEIGLSYQVAANRLQFPGGLQNFIYAVVYLEDDGTGLKVGREVSICTVANCTTVTSAPAYVDGSFPNGQTAFYGSKYTLGLSLDELSSTFTYSVSGSNLVGTGTVDATSLFAIGPTSPTADVLDSFVRVRTWDPAAAGGSTGLVGASFGNVRAGFNAGAAAVAATAQPYDDFTAPPSSTSDFSLVKWTQGEADSSIASTGALAFSNRLTAVQAAGYDQSNANSVATAALPTGMMADLTLTSFTASGGAATDAQNLAVLMTLYNDTAALSNDSTGDIWAGVSVTLGGASWFMFRCTNALCTTPTNLATGSTALIPGQVPMLLNTTHTPIVIWDAVNKRITFGVDDGGPQVVFDPTAANIYATTAPLVAPPNVPQAQIRAYNRVASSNAGGFVAGHFNNVMLK